MTNISISQSFKSRIGELDFLRGIGILGVIMVHVAQHGIYYSYGNIAVNVILDALSRFCVPFFIFVSGVAFSFNYHDQKKYFWRFFLKRLRYIGIPYLLWSIIGLVRYQIYDVKNIAIVLITGQAMIHLYFIILIFQFYLLAPLILRLFKIGWKKVLVISFILNILAFYNFIPLFANLFNGFRNPLFWISYFTAGLIVGMKIDSFRKHIGKIRLIYLVILWLVIAIISVYNEYDIYNKTSVVQHFFRPTNIVYSFMSIFLYWKLFDIINTHIRSLLVKLGKYSFGIYLVHIPILFGIHIFTKPYRGNLLEQVFAFSICAIASFIFTFLVSKMKFGVFIVGRAG